MSKMKNPSDVEDKVSLNILQAFAQLLRLLVAMRCTRCQSVAAPSVGFTSFCSWL